MRTFPDVRMRLFLSIAGKASSALNNSDPKAARHEYGDLLRLLHECHMDSPSAWWGLAVAHDYLGEHEQALDCIQKSLALDPLAPGAQRSFDIIVRRMRERLEELDAKDASIPRLYALLQQCGELDVPSHIVMARHYAATGRPEKADQLFRALCQLAPASMDVWDARAHFAAHHEEFGDCYEFQSKGHECALAKVPYAVPVLDVE